MCQRRSTTPVSTGAGCRSSRRGDCSLAVSMGAGCRLSRPGGDCSLAVSMAVVSPPGQTAMAQHKAPRNLVRHPLPSALHVGSNPDAGDICFRLVISGQPQGRRLTDCPSLLMMMLLL